jgi:hypothetical protein
VADQYHDVQPNDQHDLQACKCKFHLSIDPNEEQIADDEQEAKYGNPNARTDGRPEFNDHGCGG